MHVEKELYEFCDYHSKEITAIWDKIRNLKEPEPEKNEDDEEWARIRKIVKLMFSEHIKENIILQVKEQMTKECACIVRQELTKYINDQIKNNLEIKSMIEKVLKEMVKVPQQPIQQAPLSVMPQQMHQPQ